MPEIERKFWLRSMPRLPSLGAGEDIVQGYLFLDRGELRLRRKATRNYMTVKGDGTLSRDEWESEIPAWVFEQLWPKTNGRRIEKTRYTLAKGNRTYEIDIFRGSLHGLVLVECEFQTEADARLFVAPKWFADHRDVTSDPRFKNKNLALSELPPSFP